MPCCAAAARRGKAQKDACGVRSRCRPRIQQLTSPRTAWVCRRLRLRSRTRCTRCAAACGGYHRYCMFRLDGQRSRRGTSGGSALSRGAALGLSLRPVMHWRVQPITGLPSQLALQLAGHQRQGRPAAAGDSRALLPPWLELPACLLLCRCLLGGRTAGQDAGGAAAGAGGQQAEGQGGALHLHLQMAVLLWVAHPNSTGNA